MSQTPSQQGSREGAQMMSGLIRILPGSWSTPRAVIASQWQVSAAPLTNSERLQVAQALLGQSKRKDESISANDEVCLDTGADGIEIQIDEKLQNCC